MRALLAAVLVAGLLAAGCGQNATYAPESDGGTVCVEGHRTYPQRPLECP